MSSISSVSPTSNQPTAGTSTSTANVHKGHHHHHKASAIPATTTAATTPATGAATAPSPASGPSVTGGRNLNVTA